MTTVVLVTRTLWTELPRLRHQVARALAERYGVLFVETPTTWRRWYPTTLEEVEAGIVRCRLTNRLNLPRRARWHVPLTNDLVQARHLKEIERSLARLDWQGPDVLVNFNPDATRIMEAERFAAKLYICNDDWPAKAPGPAARKAVEAQEARVASAADACLAVSYPLVESLRRYHPGTALFLPGHDFEPAQRPPRERVEGEPIRVVFMGNVNRRVDVDWLAHAAVQPDLVVHSIGTVEVPVEEERTLIQAGVRFHAPLYGGELQRFLEAADALVIPYRLLDDVLAVTASNKLFSYIAAERPVVISDMPNFVDLGPGIIYRARSREEFVEQVRRAVREDDEALRDRRRAIAREYSWEQRGEELHRIISDVLPEPSGRVSA